VRLTALLTAAHGGALALAASLHMPAGLKTALAAALIVSLGFTVHRHGLRRNRRAIETLSFDEEDSCTIRRRGEDAARPCEIRRQFVQPRITILLLRAAGRRISETLVLMPDALDPESFRRLRARLRLRNPAA
jgi:hypothetical protein